MAAAYAGLFGFAALGGAANPVLAGLVGTALAMVAAAALGATIERVAYRPLRARARGPLARVTPLVTAIGCSVFLQNLAQLLFTARFRPYPRIFERTRPLIFVTALAVLVALELIVKRTWFGKAMRALSANEEAARLMGIPASRVIAATFALGSALAAVGAVLFCLDQSQVYPTMGFVIGTRAFVGCGARRDRQPPGCDVGRVAPRRPRRAREVDGLLGRRRRPRVPRSPRRAPRASERAPRARARREGASSPPQYATAPSASERRSESAAAVRVGSANACWKAMKNVHGATPGRFRPSATGNESPPGTLPDRAEETGRGGRRRPPV